MPRGGTSTPGGLPSMMRAENPKSRRHSIAISASSRGICRTRGPLVTLRVTRSPKASAAVCALAGMAMSTRSLIRISPFSITKNLVRRNRPVGRAYGQALHRHRMRCLSMNDIKNPCGSAPGFTKSTIEHRNGSEPFWPQHMNEDGRDIARTFSRGELTMVSGEDNSHSSILP